MRKRARKRKKKSRYHRGIHISTKAGECKYRSGWELAYMKWLDQNQDVDSYLYEGLVIPYISNVKTNKTRKYYPDFYIKYVDGSFEVVEIKPSKKVHQPKIMKKTLAAIDWCRQNNVKFTVVTEIELKAIGLL